MQDFLLIGAASFLGGASLASYFLRARKGRSIARSMHAYRCAHDRLTGWLIAKRILRFPGTCLVSSHRHWVIAEMSALVVLLVLVSGVRSGAGLAQATAVLPVTVFVVASISLRGAARDALRSVQRDLPVACFLMSLLLESGMGASPALAETSASIPEGALSRELRELVRSRSLGLPRGESIERSRGRVPVEEYRLFLNHVLQGERLGIGLSRSLRELSGKMLESQGLRAETIAQQAAVKMLFPLVFFIFPAVFLIILSPVILGLWDRLAG